MYTVAENNRGDSKTCAKQFSLQESDIYKPLRYAEIFKGVFLQIH